MHLVLVMCEACTVTVFLCLKVNLCQIINKTHLTCTLEFEMKRKNNWIHFYVAAKSSSMKNSLNTCVLIARS